MSVWALADLHLAFAVPSKTMEVFGPRWKDYADKIKRHWSTVVQPEDLVLLPGDISWAMKLEQSLIDMKWIDELPGTKVLIRGNHDYWWNSMSKMAKIFPSSIHIVHNNAFHWNDITIGGTRLWDTPEYNFNDFIEKSSNSNLPKIGPDNEEIEEDEKIFKRELQRLELSLQSLNPKAKTRIVMTHYPPIGADLMPSQASALLEKYNIDICVFGHLHNMRLHSLPFGEKNGVKYLLTAGDYVDFSPVKLL